MDQELLIFEPKHARFLVRNWVNLAEIRIYLILFRLKSAWFVCSESQKLNLKKKSCVYKPISLTDLI